MDETPDDLARRTAQGHAFDQHASGKKNEFQDPARGPVVDITSRKDLEAHVRKVLESPHTECFRSQPSNQKWRESEVFYHPPSNTLVVVPADAKHEPTVYRPKDKDDAFIEKLWEAQRHSITPIEVHRSIHELRPDQRSRMEEQKLRDAVQWRFEEERTALRARQARELTGRGTPPARVAEHAKQLQDLETARDRDLRRHIDEYRRAEAYRREIQRDEKGLARDIDRTKGRSW